MEHFYNTVQKMQGLLRKASKEVDELAVKDMIEPLDGIELQKKLELATAKFELASLYLRRLCEQVSPGTGGYARRPLLVPMEVTRTVSVMHYTWLHICLNTVLPHCRFQTPAWLTDSIHRLLDNYAATGRQLPFYRRNAVLVIDEHSDIDKRNIYDQDNKGFKAVSNALKGRIFPDDNQYDLGMLFLAKRCDEYATHIVVMEAEDLPQFLTSYNHTPIWKNPYSDD